MSSTAASLKSVGKDALVRAIEAGEQIPDHLLPVGIHRSSTYKWRAHLCTGGKKFSGPPRDTVREAVEDRRRLCEETGVEFVLYGKQSHAKAENRPAGWTGASNIQFAPDSGIGPPRPKQRVQAEETKSAVPPPSRPLVVPQVAGSLLQGEKRNRTAIHPLEILHGSAGVLPGRQDWELCAVSLEVEVGGVLVSDRFVWPAVTEDRAGLSVYLFTVLLDYGLSPSPERVESLLSVVTDQLNILRPAVSASALGLAPRDRRRLARVELCDTGAVLATFSWDAFTPDSSAVEFCRVFAAERLVASAEWLLWQLMDQVVKQLQSLQ